VLIANLYVGSPAQQAGLRPGDQILTIDGAPLRGAQDAMGRIAMHKPGSSLAIHGLRGGRQFDLKAQVIEQPRNS
jgi:S1-C subfamily serine protease